MNIPKSLADLRLRLKASTPQALAMDFRAGGKYIVLVDPTTVDMEALHDVTEADELGFEVIFIAMIPEPGKTLAESVAVFIEPPQISLVS